MSSDDEPINLGNGPMIANSFEVQLKSLEDGKNFCVLKVGTEFGEARFIFVPEEIKVLGEVCERTVEGLQLRDDYRPKVLSVDRPREMFPDI